VTGERGWATNVWRERMQRVEHRAQEKQHIELNSVSSPLILSSSGREDPADPVNAVRYVSEKRISMRYRKGVGLETTGGGGAKRKN
jgi:hypothetical protein